MMRSAPGEEMEARVREEMMAEGIESSPTRAVVLTHEGRHYNLDSRRETTSRGSRAREGTMAAARPIWWLVRNRPGDAGVVV